MILDKKSHTTWNQAGRILVQVVVQETPMLLVRVVLALIFRSAYSLNPTRLLPNVFMLKAMLLNLKLETLNSTGITQAVNNAGNQL